MLAEEEATNQVENQQQVLVTTESQLVNTKLNLGTKLHSNAKLQNEEIAHSDSKVSVHERDAKLPDRDVHSDSKAERKNEETRPEPRLSKYVKMHYPTAQIIRDKDARPITRNRLRSESFLLTKHKGAQISKKCIRRFRLVHLAMEEEIE